MSLKNRIKSSIRLKKLILWMLMPKNQSRPRLWVKLFVNPFLHNRGKHSRIRRRTRMDVMPFNKFSLGANSTIEDFTTINNGVGDVIIGDNVRIGMSNTLIGPITIHSDIRLAQNIVLSGLNHNYEDVSKPICEQGVSKNEIVIGKGTWIGANSVVLSGVKIGDNCVIAAGSIVTKSISSYSVVVGNPARVVKKYNIKSGVWEKINQ